MCMRRIEPTSHFWTCAVRCLFSAGGRPHRTRSTPAQLKARRIRFYEIINGWDRLILLGLFKKVAIADGVAPAVNSVVGSSGCSLTDVALRPPLRNSDPLDFSGYSDIGGKQAVRYRTYIEFQPPLLLEESERVLEVLAYQPQLLAARLFIYFAWRQPAGQRAYLFQPFADHAARRSLARRCMELRAVGRLSRPIAMRPPDLDPRPGHTAQFHRGCEWYNHLHGALCRRHVCFQPDFDGGQYFSFFAAMGLFECIFDQIKSYHGILVLPAAAHPSFADTVALWHWCIICFSDYRAGVLCQNWWPAPGATLRYAIFIDHGNEQVRSSSSLRSELVVQETERFTNWRYVLGIVLWTIGVGFADAVVGRSANLGSAKILAYFDRARSRKASAPVGSTPNRMRQSSRLVTSHDCDIATPPCPQIILDIYEPIIQLAEQCSPDLGCRPASPALRQPHICCWSAGRSRRTSTRPDLGLLNKRW